MKNKFILFSLCFVIIIGYFYYVNRISYIQSKSWKYGSGGHVGDYIEFKNEYLSSKIIYRHNEKIGEIIFCFGNVLIVRSIKTGNKGYYNNRKI